MAIDKNISTHDATLLFVDDEKNILSSLTRLFRSSGYQLITSQSASEALEILEKTHVDLIISDNRMPGMSGVEFLQHVAQQWPKIIRIILTGQSDLLSAINAINKGSVYKYIQKPWEEIDLKVTVRQALEYKFLELEKTRLHEQLEHELVLAREVQNSLLPGPMESGFPINGINLPAHELSGDFYDYFILPDNRIYFNLGDVSGKGVNAALLMAKTCSLFRALGRETHQPAELLQRINNELCDTSVNGMFVTMVAGLYDTKSEKLEICNAGHLPPLLRNANGEIRELSAKNPPLGIFRDTIFKTHEIDSLNSSIYIYTDGITEARVESNKQLSIDGLIDIIDSVTELAAVDRINAIISEVTKHLSCQHDDITLLLIEKMRQQ